MTISEVTAFLENAFEAINQDFYNGELPPCKITIQSCKGKAYATFTPWESWHEGEQGFTEINVAPETLNRKLEEVVGTLAHEIGHYRNYLAGVQDCSRSGLYHSKKFKIEAEKTGLIRIEYNKKYGWSTTIPTEAMTAYCQAHGWSDIDLSRVMVLDLKGGKKKGNSMKYQCPCCKCSCRSTSPINILCLDCNEEMILQEKAG